MDRHRRPDARVAPIALRNCLGQQTPFARVQALPKDGKAVASWLKSRWRARQGRRRDQAGRSCRTF
jgi:hypothetical protein